MAVTHEGSRMLKFLDKWKKGLAKTRKGLTGRLTRILKGGDPVTEALFEELEAALIEADAGVETARNLIEAVKSAPIQSDEDPKEGIRRVLKEKIRSLIADEVPNPAVFSEKPLVILVVGVNGAGKTTTIGKLAHRFRQDGKKVLLAGADTFRAAAGEQLGVWADRAGAEFVTQKPGADPASVAFDALDHAVLHHADVMIVDTAGRLHTKVNLMEELKKIRRVLGKRMPSAPHETLLVLDATTGQNGLRQAQRFTEAAAVTGIVLAKLDGTAKGGIVLGIRRETGIPVRWVGVGEGIDDLLPFDAEAFAEGMLGE
jgi:fused signal recognition particle receptor